MIKLEPAVKKESRIITVCVLILSVMMQAVFVIIGQWDYPVLTGNLLGAAAAVGNFVGMGITVQKAVEQEEADAKNLMRNSRALRSALLLLVAVLGICLPVFNGIATVIPLFFPRVALYVRPVLDRKADSEVDGDE